MTYPELTMLRTYCISHQIYDSQMFSAQNEDFLEYFISTLWADNDDDDDNDDDNDEEEEEEDEEDENYD
eukprot:jgi/Bigna1/139965/aug1.53_g14673